MKKTLLTASVACACTLLLSAVPSVSNAEEASPLTFNVGTVTEYRYRGLAQSSFKPALQGGADYASPSGYYIGAWGSTIDWIKDDGKTAGANTGSTNVEIDLYGGYKGNVGSVGYDSIETPKEARRKRWDKARRGPQHPSPGERRPWEHRG